MKKNAALLLLPSIAIVTPAVAQEMQDDIIVTAARSDGRVQSPALVIDGKALDERAPVAAADLFRAIPGLSLRVNSRGEAVVRVRGSEERQTTVFLDGAPLATPWDGRVDLALLPAGMIGRVSVIKGAAPIEYGANAVAGVVDLQTAIADDTANWRTESQVGSNGQASVSAVVTTPLRGGLSLVLGGSDTSRDGERIADRAAIPFDLATNRRRSNTDMDGTSSFAALGYEDRRGALRLSWLYAGVERGIAAQGDLDPAMSSPRYWRYPRWALDQLILAGNYRFSDAVSLRVTGWQQWFGQTIHAYRSTSYTALRSREVSDDRTSGARATLTSDWGATALRLSGTAQTSTHKQTDAITTGFSSDFINGASLQFRQNLFSIGGELDQKLSSQLDVTIGVGLDRAETPLTGDKPAQAANEAMSFYAGLRYRPTNNLALSASLGRRSRFPSPRELFGESLGRFLANPDLAPEKALLGDVSAKWSLGEALTFDANLWIADNDRTISQRIVRVGNVNRRQRYNQTGNLAYGVEASINARIASTLTAELGVAAQRVRSRQEANGTQPAVLQRPLHQLNMALDWSPIPALDIRAELVHGASAFDLSDSGSIVHLPSYTSFNLRGFFKLGTVKDVGPVALFVVADNVGDALILPQTGLPAPGRSVRLGIRIGGR